MHRTLPRRRLPAAAALLALAASAACNDKNPTRSLPGSLEVVVTATGTDADERFSIQVNTAAAETYSAGTPFVREGLAAGTYTVRISGISSNCTLQGAETMQVAVAEGQRARAAFTVACTMRWLVATEGRSTPSSIEIVRMNRDGSGKVVLTSEPSSEFSPEISPDGRRIAYASDRDGNTEIYVMNADGTGKTRLTTLPGTNDASPTWSPDGTRIAFISDAFPAPAQVRVMNADGSGLATLKDGLQGVVPPLRWSPDGARLAFAMQAPGLNDHDLYTLTVATGAVARLNFNLTPDLDPAWTGDGRLVHTAFAPEVEGAGVFAINADGTGRTLLFNQPEHTERSATLSPDGRWLAYTSQPANGGWMRLWIVPATGGTPVNVGGDSGSFFDLHWQP